MKELNNILYLISEEIIKHNPELKKGFIGNLKIEIDKILQKEENSKLKGIYITNSSYYGSNIEFTGLLSNFKFPFILYNNSFRIQILKDLNSFLQKDYTLNELGVFLSKKIYSTIDVKKGGYNEKTLELLRFYLHTFDKVLDNSFKKFEPFLASYKYKFHELSRNYFQTRFSLSQKYVNTYFIPMFSSFSLSSVLIEYQEKFNMNDLDGVPLGLLYGDNGDKKFLLLNISNKSIGNFNNNLIRKVTFYENLDLFYKNEKYHLYRNSVQDIFNLYVNYTEDNFQNTAIEYTIDFKYKNRNFNENYYDLESLVHIFNTRKLPVDFELHPILNSCFSYRNKITTLYTSINYIIHIFDIKNRNLDRYSELFNLLIKNTFANGFIIHFKTGLLISTNAFKEDFEKVRKEFQEFIRSFKLHCEIFENLNYIPFSFYLLPNSQYYSNEKNLWEFPKFKDEITSEYFNHLALNYSHEIKRLEDTNFKNRVEKTLEKLENEITEIKKKKKK